MKRRAGQVDIATIDIPEPLACELLLSVHPQGVVDGSNPQGSGAARGRRAVNVSDEMLDATGPELGGSRGAATSTVGPPVAPPWGGAVTTFDQVREALASLPPKQPFRWMVRAEGLTPKESEVLDFLATRNAFYERRDGLPAKHLPPGSVAVIFEEGSSWPGEVIGIQLIKRRNGI